MKSIIGSVSTLIILILTVIAATVLLDAKTAALIDDISSTEDCEEEISELYEKYRKEEWILSLCVSDDLLYNTEDAFGEWRESVKNGASDTSGSAKSRLIRNLTHIRRLSGFNFKAIF